MARLLRPNSYFLHDETSGDIVGFKDPDGSEVYFARAPHFASFADLSIQSASPNTETDMECDTTEVANGIAMVSNSRITVTRTAVYNIQFSAQLRNAANDERTVSVWLANAAGNVDDTNTFVTVPKKHAGGDSYLVAAWNYYMHITAGEWVKLVWSVNGSDVTLDYSAEQVSPARPKTPSVIITVNEVGAVP